MKESQREGEMKEVGSKNKRKMRRDGRSHTQRE
jgi:hypothetical protein